MRKSRCPRRPYDCPCSRQSSPAMPVRGSHKDESAGTAGVKDLLPDVRRQVRMTGIYDLKSVYAVIGQPGNVIGSLSFQGDNNDRPSTLLMNLSSKPGRAIRRLSDALLAKLKVGVLTKAQDHRSPPCMGLETGDECRQPVER